MTVQIDIHSESRFPIDRRHLRQIVIASLARFNLRREVAVEVAIVGDRKMRQLNREYRHIQETTSVLSFPMEDPGANITFFSPPDNILRLGSIVISYPQAVALAAEEGVMVDEKIKQLLEHGIKSLLGD